jgi:hypothetical protein
MPAVISAHRAIALHANTFCSASDPLSTATQSISYETADCPAAQPAQDNPCHESQHINESIFAQRLFLLMLLRILASGISAELCLFPI